MAEFTGRDRGDARAARAAQKAGAGRIGEIARLGRAVDIHLVCCTHRPDVEAVPGQLKANPPRQRHGSPAAALGRGRLGT
ncbi:MAG: hypothetical protein ACYDD0_01765 [Candidatus Dormibacteria bacterium]